MPSQDVLIQKIPGGLTFTMLGTPRSSPIVQRAERTSQQRDAHARVLANVAPPSVRGAPKPRKTSSAPAEEPARPATREELRRGIPEAAGWLVDHWMRAGLALAEAQTDWTEFEAETKTAASRSPIVSDAEPEKSNASYETREIRAVMARVGISFCGARAIVERRNRARAGGLESSDT